MSSLPIYNANYVILTADQFATDYPNAARPSDGDHDSGDRVLVFHDDDESLLMALWGSSNDFATFTADLAQYAKSQADPGTVVPKVGRNVTELADR